MRAWPANPAENEYSRVRDSGVPTLLVGGELDFATPPQVATRELLPHLSNGRQVVLAGIGHTTSFWQDQRRASARLLSAYLDSGRVDDSLYVPGNVDFTPDVSQTALAKGIVGTMLGFVAIAILSLLLMWRRVHRHGGFGRKASALLRSIWLLVLGLGGWFAGLIVLLVGFPTVPLDDVLAAVLAIGLPVGLGTYWAWRNRDQSSKVRNAGFAAATGGALVGALLGYHAGTGMLAVFTTIVGAAIGANLPLIVLDIVRGSSSPEPTEAPHAALTAA